MRLGLDGRGLDDGVQVGPHRHLVDAVVRAFSLAAAGDAPYLRDGPPERADVLQGVVCFIAPHPLANLGKKKNEREWINVCFSERHRSHQWIYKTAECWCSEKKLVRHKSFVYCCTDASTCMIVRKGRQAMCVLT